MNWLQNLYGNFYFSVNLQDSMSDGSYQLVFREKVLGSKKLAQLLVPSFKVGQAYTDENGRRITITGLTDSPDTDGNYYLDFVIVNGQAQEVKAGFWAEAIFVVVGLALALFTVVEIRKTVAKSTVTLLLLALSAVLIYALYKLWWVKRA